MTQRATSYIYLLIRILVEISRLLCWTLGTAPVHNSSEQCFTDDPYFSSL